MAHRRKRNDHATERRNCVARTYRIDEETVALIDGMASVYGVWPSAIVDLLLRIGLEEVDAGRRVLKRKAIQYAVALDPYTPTDS